MLTSKKFCLEMKQAKILRAAFSAVVDLFRSVAKLKSSLFCFVRSVISWP